RLCPPASPHRPAWEPSARPSVSVSPSEPATPTPARSASALHVILGIAVTDAEAFVYAVAATLGNPGGVTISLAVAPGSVAAVALISRQTRAAGRRVNYRVGMKDREIVAAIAAGDPAGLAGAYDKYAESVHGYCGWMLSEPDRAADAVRDTFVIAAANLGGLCDPGRLRPWLYAVARNQCHRRLHAGEAGLDEAAD